MASQDWLHSSLAEAKGDLSGGEFYDNEAIHRPRGKPRATLVKRTLHYTNQTDVAQPQTTSTKFHRRRTPRFKHSSSSSSGSLPRTSNTVLPNKSSPNIDTIDTITFAKLRLNENSISTLHTGTMLDLDRPRSRKERTFMGGQCAVCEFPLEHKSSGEKVLQFSCGHVAHETCLRVYIDDDEEEQFCPMCDAPLGLDTTRGGNVLDLNKLSSTVRSIVPPASEAVAQPSLNSSKTWDVNSMKEESPDIVNSIGRANTYNSVIEGREGVQRIGGGDSPDLAKFNDSGNSSQPDEAPADARKHDYDLSAMEGRLMYKDTTKDIPRPKVTIRSEFPTLTRSTQAQSLTCLVTIEVPATRTRVRSVEGHHPRSAPVISSESPQALEAVASDIKARVDNWHGLDTDKFGPLRLHANLKVGRDGTNWQKLDCFLFSELLICVREKRASPPSAPGQKPVCQLKGSILIKKHLQDVQHTADDLVLTLNLAVASLPTFRLKFSSREQLDVWRLALMRLDLIAPSLFGQLEEHEASGTEDEEGSGRRPSSIGSSTQADSRTATTAPTDYAEHAHDDLHLSAPIHVPIDVVVVIPLSSSMQGLKIKLLKDALRFIITHLGERDRMGLVTFGSNGGAVPLVGMAPKDWYGWRDVYRSIKPIGQKSLRADAVEGANVALDLLSQRKDANPISSVLLISDSPTYETESMDFVVQRAQTTKVSIFSFGLGQTHKPDSLIELSSRTNASYVYVKDWMMIRECVAGCLGSLQSVSHVSAKLKLKIPEGSTARFVKVSGALHATKRTSGRDAEAILGDLRFGDKRDVLVQLTVDPDAGLNQDAPQDHWDTLVSGLATLGGSLDDGDLRPLSVEEVPLVQADLSYGDLAKEGAIAHLSHPSLLTITMLPGHPKNKRTSRGSIMPPIPSHPSIVQRRMEMLTSDMLTRALTLVSKGQHESAHRLLAETRTILQGLGKGNLPPLPPVAASHSRPRASRNSSPRGSGLPKDNKEGKDVRGSPKIPQTASGRASPRIADEKSSSSSSLPLDISAMVPKAAASIDSKILHGLDADIEACLEFIDHPAVFSHDARKAALQTISVISSQRGYTFRTETEAFWASRISGVRRMGDITKDWQMVGNDTVTETVAEEQ